MSRWLDQQISSHHLQLALTAVLSGLTVAGIIFTSQAIRKQIAIDDLKASIPNSEDDSRVQEVIASKYFICQVNVIDRYPIIVLPRVRQPSRMMKTIE